MIQFKCVEAVGLHSIDQVWLAFGSARPVASTTVVVCSSHRPNRDLEMQTDSGSLYSLSIPRRDEKTHSDDDQRHAGRNATTAVATACNRTRRRFGRWSSRRGSSRR